jgi:hypothetical protein
MIAVEVKGRDPKFTLELEGIYRAPNECCIPHLGSMLYLVAGQVGRASGPLGGQ